MQRAKIENLKVLNHKLDEWSKMCGLSLNRKAKAELVEIIDSQANRVTAQRISLHQESFATSFRSAFPHRD